jgi:hypothetical protein
MTAITLRLDRLDPGSYLEATVVCAGKPRTAPRCSTTEPKAAITPTA